MQRLILAVLITASAYSQTTPEPHTWTPVLPARDARRGVALQWHPPPSTDPNALPLGALIPLPGNWTGTRTTLLGAYSQRLNELVTGAFQPFSLTLPPGGSLISGVVAKF
jgi:hypothetical protein